ncbi:MAG TPA: penicillin-binding protein 2 [Candidatus Doudnabacteria bacterium]|nr:penicillin-binding protein 2 [Candidatus Doudnabacteria bacterium]
MKSVKRNPFYIESGSNASAKSGNLEWEEGVQAGSGGVEGFNEPEERSVRQFRGIKFFIILIGVIFGLQLINLQVVQGERMRELSEGNRLRLQTILAPRGFIQDRHGEVLARNTASFNLALTPVDLPEDNQPEIFAEISAHFEISPEELTQKLANHRGSPLEPIIVKRNLTQQESIAFEVHAQRFPGFSLLNIPVRDYLSPETFAHVMGYTGVISDKEYQELRSEKYTLNDFIGKSGIEYSYERFLRGLNGNKQVEVNSLGLAIKELGVVEPQPGNIVELTIDAGLQRKIFEDFIKSPVGNKGAAVAMNPKTGEILALVSVPGFNNNLFAPGISSQDYEKLITDKNLPLFNRAIAGVYPPGSVIKPVGAAAVLQEGIVQPNTIIVDRGLLVIPNQFNPAITYNFVGWKRDGLGPMDVRSAIAESSDIYFYVVSGGHPSSPIKGIGAEKLAEYYDRFGMGRLSGIDIPGEKPARVATPQWKASYYTNDAIMAKWYLGDTYHISIGQGDMLATPLQVTAWTAAVANDGILKKPRLLKQVLNQHRQTIFTPEATVYINAGIDLEHMRVVQAGMRDNVTSDKGSGRSLQSLPITSAGKTGTSQFDGSDPKKTHAWYTAYAPYENPEIAITVLVEAGGEGHAAAVPIVKNALQWWAENRMGK